MMFCPADTNEKIQVARLGFFGRGARTRFSRELRARSSAGSDRPPEGRSNTASPSSPFPLSKKNKRNRTLCILFLLFWQGRKDSNPGHPVLETGVLPTELHPYARIILYQLFFCLSRCFEKKIVGFLAFLAVT